MKTVLWFSGGKDSMACLYLMRDKLHEITVLWANTGKNYPELLQTVEKAKAMCPHWIEVRADRDAQWNANGLPSDIVPIDWTVMGQAISSKKQVTIQSYLQCCFENITGPLLRKTKALGATTVIKGQRLDESHRSTAKSGDVADGITFIHPIENWTREGVMTYLSGQMDVPEHFKLDHSSMDCYDCTAFAAHSVDRAEFMRAEHPSLYEQYIQNIGLVMDAIAKPFSHYEQIRGASCHSA